MSRPPLVRGGSTREDPAAASESIPTLPILGVVAAVVLPAVGRGLRRPECAAQAVTVAEVPHRTWS